MRREKRIRDGFSLVEMMVIIGIIGILVGGVGLSIGLLRAADTKGAAYDINSALTNLKSMTTGGKEQPYLYLYSHSNNYYLDVTYEKPDTYTPTTDAKEIGDSLMKISYDLNEADDLTTPICIAFRKKDGAFLVDGECICPNKIYVGESDSGASDADYVICLVQDTGHHYIEGQ